MLELFRRYQKVFLIIVTVMVFSSFIFYGTFSTFTGGAVRPDRAIGKNVRGASMMASEVQQLSRFLMTDREDPMQGRGEFPNLCNDGVIRYDFLRDGLASLLVQEYFESLQGDFTAKLERVKRFKPYAHPEAPLLSAKTVWDHFVPELNQELAALQEEEGVSPKVFAHLEKLYQCQCKLRPEMLRQILIYQHRQQSWLKPDPKLSYEDMALFGFHSASDWFGRNFVDLISQFILNAAVIAEEKGYRVSLEEAKGDLIHIFDDTMERLKEAKPEISFYGHLRQLGFEEREASAVWRKVLLFRKYFQDVGESAFIDQLPYKDFAAYAKEKALVQVYRFPIAIRSAQELAELRFYMKAITAKEKEGIPEAILSIDEVEKKVPELVCKTVQAKVAEVSKKQVGLRPTLREVWNWEIEHWELLAKQFGLSASTGKEERFQTMEQSGKQAEIDAWARDKMVDEHPEWVDEALAAAPLKERTWVLQGSQELVLRKEGVYYRVEDVEVIQEKHILTFQEAKEALSKLVPKTEAEFDPNKTPFAAVSSKALASLQKEGSQSSWLSSEKDPLIDQFKLHRSEQTILRTSREDWMKEQAFMMNSALWSPIHVAENGEVVFFYLQEKQTDSAPILDQLFSGKETLSADAKRYATERLLEMIQKKHAIVLPIQKEDE